MFNGLQRGWRSLAMVAGLSIALANVLAAESPDNSSLESTNGDPVAWLNISPNFQKRVEQRVLLDKYAAKFYGVEEELLPGPVSMQGRRRVDERMVQVFRPEFPEAVANYRLTNSARVHPLRGFSAPILSDIADFRPIALPVARLDAKQREAAQLIRRTLAHDGLVRTLARSLDLLGAARFTTNGVAGLRELRDLGLPVDLLKHFKIVGGTNAEPGVVIAAVAKRLANGEKVEALSATEFHFVKTDSNFRIAEEAGEQEIGFVRLQVGGGFRNGVVPGGSLDVSGQLIAAMPRADFIGSVPEEFVENVRRMALSFWQLSRPDRLILIPEKTPVSAWAQDNGKAGYSATTGKPVTLATRFASLDEINSLFIPGESFLMDGLNAAGHAVLHSPLMFQGGNLLAVRDPKSGQRVLVMSETEINRNVPLGLTPAQIQEAFRVELGVDRCVVMPAISYHLDYDVTLRVVNGEVVAFVNDAPAAARLAIQRVIEAWLKGGVLTETTAQTLRADLAKNDVAALVKHCREAMQPHLSGEGRYRNSLVRLFSAKTTDAPVQNLQCFLAGLDLLASEVMTGANAPKSPDTQEYFSALHDLEATAMAQREQLKQLGWKVVLVPSMPDLYCSMNFLNGLQDRDRFLMPALGGFYESLDDAAAAVFRTVVGESVRVIPIYTADLQLRHGAVHCVAAVYPRLPGNAGTPKRAEP